MFFQKILTKLGIHSSRTKNITKHVLLSIFYKGGSVLATFLIVPLTIKLLDTENYGIWLTLSSFIAWFSFFDIGLGNGLRNKFAEARANGDMELAKGYVSTAYYTLGSVCVVFFSLSLIVSYTVDWAKIFNTSQEMQGQLQLLMPVVLGCFSLQLLFKLITSVYLADQNHSFSGKLTFLISFGSLLLIWILSQTSYSSLLIFGIVISLLPVLILMVLNVYAFSHPYKLFRPKRSYWNKTHFKDIFGQGISFFVIQISVIVLVSTDNFIITQILGPEEVVPYNIAYKYIGISVMLLQIVITPYWSSFTDAYTKEDMVWIRKSMQNLMKIVFLTVLFTIVLVLIAPFVYKLWIGELVQVPSLLTLCMAVYFITTICYGPFVIFINGVGKIKLQMYSLAMGALINIPLSIILLKYTSLGVEAVIIATFLCVVPNLILYPVQYFKLVNKTASGIWNK